MSRSFAFQNLRPLLLAALFLAIGGTVHAQTVSLDFETVGQLTNNFAFLAANSTNPTTSTVYGEAAAVGVGGSRGVDLVGSGDNTGVYTNRSFSFRPGQFLGASMKFKLKTATGSGRALSFGFLNTTNEMPGSLTSFGSVYFTTIRLNTLGANASLQLEHQHRQTELTASNTYPVLNSSTVATNTTYAARWYRMSAVFFNSSTNTTTTTNTHRYSVAVQDYGTDGTTPGPVVYTSAFGAVTINNTNLANATNVFFGFRGADSAGGDIYDDVRIYTNAFTPLIEQPPIATTNVTTGTRLALSAGIDVGPVLPTVQWQSNGVNIAGATSPNFLSVPLGTNANGAVYRVIVTNVFGAVTSAVCTVTVSDSIVAPTLLSAGSLDPLVIGVAFSKSVHPAVAQLPGNFVVVSGGATHAVSNVVIRPDGQNVQLRLYSPLVTPAFTVTVQNMADQSGNPLSGSATVAGTVRPLSVYDVGSPTTAGSTATFGDGYFEQGSGGADLWNAGDQGHLAMATRTGDFDVVMQVAELRLPDEGLNMPRQQGPPVAKAGIIVRESTSANARGLQMVALPQTSLINAPANRYEHGVRTNLGAAMFTFNSSPSGLNYPNVWLRMRRANQSYSLFFSTNGTSWARTGQTNFVLSDSLLVGPGGTVHFNQAALASTAVIRNYGDYQPAGISIVLTNDLSCTNAGPLTAGQVTGFSTLAGVAGTTNRSEVSYLWQRYDTTGGVWTNIPNASSLTNGYINSPLTEADNGAKFRVVVTAAGATPVVTSELSIGSITDAAAPTVASISRPLGTQNILVITFSEPVGATAINTGNYTVTNSTGGAVAVSSAAFFGNNRTVVLTLGSALGTNGAVVINGVKDLAAAANTMSGVVSAFTTPSTAAVAAEFFLNLPNTGLADLTNAAPFLANAPDSITASNLLGLTFPTISNVADNYAARFTTWFTAPSSDIYRFHARVDDSVQLWMNTNLVNSTDPGGKNILFSQNNYPGFANIYTNLAALVSAPITLTAGQSYYMEALYKEGTGGDGFGIAYSLGAAGPIPASNSVLTAAGVVNAALTVLPVLTQPTGPAALDITPSGAINLAESGFVTLTITNAAGAAPYAVQWFRNGQPIPGAGRHQYGRQVFSTNNGDQYYAVLQNQFSAATSTVATLAISPDATAPAITNILARDLTTITVSLSEQVAPASAAVLGNYALTNAAGVNVPVNGAILDPTGFFITLFTAPMAGGTPHTLAVGAVRDLAGPGNPVNASASFVSSASSPAFIRVEIFTNIAGTTVSTLRSATKFILNQPDSVYYTNGFSAGLGLDNYGLRLSGYFVPTNSGLHTFYMESDDGAELWISSDATRAGATLGIVHTGNTAGYAEARSFSVNMTAGQRYFIEALLKEGTGGDFIRVAVRVPGNTVAAASLTPIPFQLLAGFAEASGLALQFTQSPADTAVVELGSATFIAVATGQPSSLATNLFYQWETNGVAVPGLTGGSFTLPVTPLSLNGLQVRARALMPGTNLLSAAATLTVTPDTTAPGVTNAAFAGMHRVVLRLDEPVTAASAANLSNYSITNAAGSPLSIVSATLGSTGNRVVLTTAVPASGAAYTLVVTGLTDTAVAANPMTTSQLMPLSAWVRSPGFLFAEGFTNISGTTVTNLTNSAKFRDLLPESAGVVTNFNINSTNLLGLPVDNYGARVGGFFIPPTNGHYTFHLRSDDASQLFLNTNSVNSEDPQGVTLIAREDSCCKSYGDTSAGGPRFASISNLVAGQRYYMEGLLKDGSANDYLMVNVVAAGAAVPGNSTAMDRTFFETYAPPASASLAFSLSPSMPSVDSGAAAMFTGSATNAPSSLDGIVFYQWLTNGLLVPLANGGSFTTPPVTALNKAVQYQLVAGVPGLSITSAVVMVNLNPTAVPDSLTTDSNVVLVVFAPKLALNDSDADGDAITVVGVSATSTSGGSVSLSGSVIYYTPPVDYTGSDGFTYTLNDARGGTATGSVLLSVGPVSGLSMNLASVGLQAGQPRVTFFGIPGRSYYIQTAPDVGGPWRTEASLQADSKGRIIFLDAEDPLPPQRFYRTSTTP